MVYYELHRVYTDITIQTSFFCNTIILLRLIEYTLVMSQNPTMPDVLHDA